MQLKDNVVWSKIRSKFSFMDLGCIGIIACFFIFLYAYFPVGFYPDSETYVTMGTAREPGYPILIFIFNTVFKSSGYIMLALFQNLLAFLITVYSYLYFTKLVKKSILFSTCILGSLLVPHILTPLASSSGMVFTNGILSEGIVFPLYLLAIVLIVKGALEKNSNGIKYEILSIIVIFLLSITRSHLMFMILIWGVVFASRAIIYKKWKSIIWIALTVIIVFGCKSLFIKSYNLIVNDQFINNTGGNASILTNILYTTDLDQISELEEKSLQDVYDEIRNGLLENKLNYSFASKGLINQVQYHEYSHDLIKFDVVNLPIYFYVKEQGYTEPVDIAVKVDEVSSQLIKELTPEFLVQFIPVYIQVAMGGLIRTVAFIHPIMNWYAVIIYLVAIVLTTFLFMRWKKKRIPSNGAVLMLIGFLAVCANVAATSLVIMCLSRYMIYNTSLFYIGLLVVTWEIFNNKEKIEDYENGI